MKKNWTPKVTNSEARRMAESTFAIMDEYKRRITVLTQMLDIAYPLLPEDVQTRLQAMALQGAPTETSST